MKVGYVMTYMVCLALNEVATMDALTWHMGDNTKPTTLSASGLSAGSPDEEEDDEAFETSKPVMRKNII
jgi:hypothetical protein